MHPVGPIRPGARSTCRDTGHKNHADVRRSRVSRALDVADRPSWSHANTGSRTRTRYDQHRHLFPHVAASSERATYRPRPALRCANPRSAPSCARLAAPRRAAHPVARREPPRACATDHANGPSHKHAHPRARRLTCFTPTSKTHLPFTRTKRVLNAVGRVKCRPFPDMSRPQLERNSPSLTWQLFPSSHRPAASVHPAGEAHDRNGTDGLPSQTSTGRRRRRR